MEKLYLWNILKIYSTNLVSVKYLFNGYIKKSYSNRTYLNKIFYVNAGDDFDRNWVCDKNLQISYK